MFRLNLFLKMNDGMFLVDELWSTDKEELSKEGSRRLANNSDYLGILTTYVASSTETLEIPALDP